MSFSLSFSPDFFHGAGTDVQPASVSQAIAHLTDETRKEIAQRVFGSADVSDEAILQMVLVTNTCSNLDSPVEVWIDPEGEYRLKVFDSLASNYIQA